MSGCRTAHHSVFQNPNHVLLCRRHTRDKPLPIFGLYSLFQRLPCTTAFDTLYSKSFTYINCSRRLRVKKNEKYYYRATLCVCCRSASLATYCVCVNIYSLLSPGARLSICPSVCLSRWCNFFVGRYPIILVFDPQRRYQFKGDSLQRGRPVRTKSRQNESIFQSSRTKNFVLMGFRSDGIFVLTGRSPYSMGTQNTRWWENRRVSRKRHEIGPWLLWDVNRKSHALYRIVTCSMTLTDP